MGKVNGEWREQYVSWLGCRCAAQAAERRTLRLRRLDQVIAQ